MPTVDDADDKNVGALDDRPWMVLATRRAPLAGLFRAAGDGPPRDAEGSEVSDEIVSADVVDERLPEPPD